MAETKKLGFVYLVRDMSEGNVYIPVKEKIMRVHDSCLGINFEIDRFVIYFYFFIGPNNVLIYNPFLQQRYRETLTTIAEVHSRMERVS